MVEQVVDTIYQKIRGIAPGLFHGENIAGAYKNKLFKDGANENIEPTLIEALRKYETILGQCEHNRWNVQQLLMEFSPCGKHDDEICCMLNDAYRQTYLKKKEYDEKSLPYNIKIAFNEAKDDFKSKKESLKESEDRVHPNICGYSHLDEVDFGAKQFDINMNNAIPVILMKVDGYKYLK